MVSSLMNRGLQKIWVAIMKFMACWCFLLLALVMLGLGIWQWYFSQEAWGTALVFSVLIPAAGLYFFVNYPLMEQDLIKKKNQQIRQEMEKAGIRVTGEILSGKYMNGGKVHLDHCYLTVQYEVDGESVIARNLGVIIDIEQLHLGVGLDAYGRGNDVSLLVNRNRPQRALIL